MKMMPVRSLLLSSILVVCLSCNAQIIDVLDSDSYHSRVKLVSEFMQRFNGEEKNPCIDSVATDVDKINLCQLFDIEYLMTNRQELEPKAFQFIDSVIQNNVKIHYSDAEWYAKVQCIGAFKGKEVTFSMYLTVEPRGNDMYKWVISDVEGTIFELTPSRKSEKIMLLPNEHESNFMRLNSITAEKDDYITLYSSECHNTDRLAVFNTLVYYGYLDIDYVTDIEYTFLQVPGYIFTIKEYERETANSGWLIKDWRVVSGSDKESLLQRIYKGRYTARKSAESDGVAHDVVPQIDATAAIEKVEQFVKYLNDYITDKSLIKEINSAVEGRYTFIISDELSNQLSKKYKSKTQESYRLDTLLGWLGRKDSPVESIQVSDLELFVNDDIRPEYKIGYTHIKCELSTTGDLQIGEQVVFFIYEDQIAGVKLVSDCF